jgi:LCP family protein required for cell wall assembly
MDYSSYHSDQRKPKHKIILWGLLGVSALALILWFALGPILAWRKIYDASRTDQQVSSLFGFLGKIVSSRQLKGEEEGRINILLLGIGGKDHPGGTLTDTIQVVSVNTKDKQVAILSIPRDLKVTIPGAGISKINYAYAYGELYPKTGGGPAVAREVVSNILDLPIHYYARLDFAGFVKLVDALGGVDIEVEKAINDPFYPAPDMIHYDPFRILAGKHHLDGKTALKYVRSRETTSDFDRSQRQQQMMQALKERVLSLNILANPKKINEIASILGDHVRTDLAAWEIARLIEVASREASSYTLLTRVLSSGPGEPLVAVNEGGYYLVPKSGNFKEIQRIAREIFSESLIAGEKAKIEVVNASGKSRTLNQVVENLKNQGYIVAKSRTTPNNIQQTIIYDYSSGTKPNTARLLSQLFKAKIEPHEPPAGANFDLSLIIGVDYQDSTI